MITTYFRSSSFADYRDYCQQKYFISYILGYNDKANIKAEKGTVTHKVLEILALCRLAEQEGKDYIDDDVLGKFTFDKELLHKPFLLQSTDIAKANKQRSYKTKYSWDCLVADSHTRYGVDIVEDIFEKVYEYYSSRSEHVWTKTDKIDCLEWVWVVCDYHNRIYDPRNQEIFQPEHRFDIEIKEDWAKYDFELDGQKYTGNLRLKGTIDLITKANDSLLEVCDYKGLPLDTPIPTPTGWTTMGDLKVGDIIFDENGQQTIVTVKTIPKIKPCFKITFDDTSSVICDDEHLWKLSTGEILKVTELKNNDKIYLTKPLEISNKILPIDPYVLGVWLGDGRNRGGEICGVDKFIFEEITKRGYICGPDISCKDSCPTHTIYGLTTELRKLNLLHNKHIPQIYLRSSYQQRLDLLRGLMDSDGSVNLVRKQCIFTNCNQILSTDVKELLLTLGQRPLQSNVTVDTNFKQNVKVYPISFKPIDINPFLLPRKSNQVDPNWGYGKSYIRSVRKIEQIEDKFTQCITVDSDTSTYLCTENMIPTHNTGSRINWGTGQKKTYEVLQNDKQLMLYYYALRKLYPQYDSMMTIFYIRDGGPFTMCFDDSTIVEIEDIIRKTFEDVKSNIKPQLRSYFQEDRNCQWCTFFKYRFPEDDRNICSRIRDDIEEHGIDYATAKWKKKNHSFSHYQAPGE